MYTFRELAAEIVADEYESRIRHYLTGVEQYEHTVAETLRVARAVESADTGALDDLHTTVVSIRETLTAVVEGLGRAVDAGDTPSPEQVEDGAADRYNREVFGFALAAESMIHDALDQIAAVDGAGGPRMEGRPALVLILVQVTELTALGQATPDEV